VLSPVEELPVGRLAVVADPFGNPLVLVDLSKGRYAAPGTDAPAGRPSGDGPRVEP
jgi:hypothetical protein